MSREIVTLGLDDYDETIRFLNHVFTEAHCPHDFERLLPKLYQRNEEAIAWNRGIREDGELRGVVGTFPIDWQVGDVTLRVAGIGGVATHPEHRGAGYMRDLMADCVERMHAHDYHMSYLSGRRQRYQRFGYETCGTSYVHHCSRRNFRDVPAAAVELAIEPLRPDDDDRVAKVHRLRHSRPVHCSHAGSRFMDVLISNGQLPQVALDPAGEVVACLVLDGDGISINEVIAGCPETAFEAVRGWVNAQDGLVRVSLLAADAELGRRLWVVSERIEVMPSGNWQIFDWPTTVAALMQIRVAQGGTPDGRLRLAIAGHGVLEIQVAGDAVAAAFADVEPDLECDALVAMRLLFGPVSPSQVAALPDRASIIEAWSPLPLGWPVTDRV